MSSMGTNRTLARVLRSPALAVAAAFLLRMVLLWLSHRGENHSQPKFETVGLEAGLVASSLAAGKGFFGPYPRYQALTGCLAPVYPFLWAIGRKLLHLTDFGSVVLAQVMNSTFSAATCWPIFSLGKRLFSARVGLGSAWSWVVLPYAVLLPLEWTWDQSLSALLLALILCASFKLTASPSLALTGYGLLWALAALVNPTLCILLPFLLGWMIFRSGKLGRLSLASAAKVLFVFVLALLPWTIRNYYALDGLVFIKSNFGMELWLGNNPAVKEVYTPQLHPMSDKQELLLLIVNGEPNYNREKQREAIAFIRAYPGVFLKNTFERFKDTWTATYDSRVEPWIVVLHLSRADVWFCLGFSILSWAGLILALRSRGREVLGAGWRRGLRAEWPDALPLALCVLLLPIPYYITHTALRYRHPIDPLLTLFAVYALARIGRAFGSSRGRKPATRELSSREEQSVSVAQPLP